MNILLSYPRSGSTWLRYCMEALTGQSSYGQNPNGTIGANNFDKPMVGKGEPILVKRHAIVRKFVNDTDTLILLLRDYKECIPRHNFRRGVNLSTLESNTGGEITNLKRVDYVSNVEAYRDWKGKKYIVYYEDLLTNPKETLTDLLLFLGRDKDVPKVEGFMKKYPYHKKKALSIYGQSHTQGKAVKHHVGKIENPNQWDRYMKKFNFRETDRYADTL